MDDQFDDIMERIRVRQNQLSDDVKENDLTPVRVPAKKEAIQVPIISPSKVFGTSSKPSNSDTVPPKTPVVFRAAERNESTPQNGDATSNDTTSNLTSSSTKKSRFSALAQELEDFEFDYTSQYNKPKEAYMKGRSPRMSLGTTITAKVPQAQPSKSADAAPIVSSSISQSEFEARRIKFAQPIVNVNYLPNESSIFSGSSVNDMSTVLGGCADMMNVTTSSLSCTEMSMNQQITHENTVINAQSCDNREAILKERHTQNASMDEYGAHTFMRKKTPKSETAQIQEEEARTPTTTTSSVNTLVSSPKPYSKDVGKSLFSPVHFTPRSTSSPKFQPPEGVMSPSKTAAVQGSVAKTRMMQFEQKWHSSHVPAPSAPVPTPRHHVTKPAPVKKELFPEKTITTKPIVTSSTELPAHVQTQWRGQANTPVVQGARADDKTAGPDVHGAGVGKLKNLKSRWEFSSVTGTPIHPDATEDSLIACAKKMHETAIPKAFKIGNRSISGRKGPSASSISSQHQQATRSTTASPAAKSIRYGNEVLEDHDDVFGDEAPENNDEEDPVEDDDDDMVIPEDDTSRIIDHAFGFMEGAGTGTPSPYRSSLDGKAPLARFEGSVSPKRLVRKELLEHQEVIEEEDVPVGGDTDDETETERLPRGDIRPVERQFEEPQEKERLSSDTSLPYSVSFYRKKQRERVEEANTPLTPVQASAPSITSPQSLKYLTAGHSAGDYSTPPGARYAEGEREQKERLIKAIRVEEEQVSQSKRALAFSREKASFRGSREEFESQRALLVHVEKHRALAAEYERLKRDGRRLIDGPRGTVEVCQLTVNMARDFVSAHIASTKKPDEVFYFLAVLRYAEQCEVSPMVTSDGALNRKGVLEFPMPLKLKEIPADFRATVEIYGQRSMRESATHEDKFKLKSSTLKSKTRNTFLGGSGSAANTSAFVQPTSCSTNFNLLGSFSFDINCPGKHVYTMSHNVHPLDGVALMKVRKAAVDGTDITYSGFMSMYQRTQEFGSWTRYWCVVDNGEMRFWRHPEDETTKRCIVLIDLSTCIRSEGAVPVNDVCPYPNSFQIDVWVPKPGETDETMFSTRGTIEQLRVMLAADTNADMHKWMSVINATSKQLCTWRNPIIQ